MQELLPSPDGRGSEAKGVATPAPSLGPLEASPGAATFTERLLAFALPRLLDDPDKVRTHGMCLCSADRHDMT